MNELQVRLTGDISALQSALTKAKRSISEFEKQTESETNKSNVGFRRKIGLIEALTNKSKQLRVALSKATNENEIERYNQELEQTIKEMNRLNALGRQVGNTLGGANNGFNQATQSIGSANGVALEFNRIIQDAPFGIIGIGNNLQQLAGNFSAASKQAGGAGKAIAASFTALLSPANLALLAISAITAGFTAYQMGAFDFLKSNEDAIKSLEDYRESLDKVTRATIEGAASAQDEVQSFKLLQSQAENANIPLKDRIEAVDELQRKFPDYLGNLTQEQILTGNVGSAYSDLTREIIATAKARAFSDEIANNSLNLLTREQQELERVNLIITEREKLESIQESKRLATGQDLLALSNQEKIQQQRINDLVNQQVSSADERVKIEEENVRLQNKITESISNGARFTDSSKESVTGLNTALKETNEISKFFDEIWNRNLEVLNKNEQALKDIALAGEQTVSTGDFNPQETADEAPPFAGITDEQLKAIQDRNKLIEDSFSALGIGIAASLNISDNALKGFITTVLSSAPKIISAIIAQAQAQKAAAAITNQANAQQATGNAIVTATSAAKGLGPIGLAALPVLIGGALALISSAFSKTGTSSGGGSVSGGASATPTIFTNQNTVSPPTPNSPSNTPFDANINNEQGTLIPMWTWDGFYIQKKIYDERRGNG